jgi:hypothetical protein
VSTASENSIQLPPTGGQRPEPQASWLPRRTNRYASSDDRRARCDLRSADAEGADRPLGECSVWARLTDGRCPLEAGGQLCAVRPDLPGLCQRPRRCMRPQIPDSHRVVWGLTARPPGSPRRAFLRFPVCPPGSSPSPAFLWFPFVRRSPVRSLRPLPGSGSPSVSLRGPFPLSDLHGSAAARRFRRPWSRAAGAKVTSNAAPPRPIVRPARTPDGRRPGTMGCRHRIACDERPRAQDTAAPEPPRSAGRRAVVNRASRS